MVIGVKLIVTEAVNGPKYNDAWGDFDVARKSS